MTIAQNILTVSLNWSGSPSEGKYVVGAGYIPRGHSDNNPTNSLDASNDDNDGYFGTGNALSAGPEQKRTLTLNNGEVIWDLSGNVWEWTSGQTTGEQPGVVGGGFAWRAWTAITTPGSLSVDPSPSGLEIAGSSTWNASNYIGQVYSSADDTSLHSFLRSASWGYGSNAGVLTLSLATYPSGLASDIGFRVSSPGI